MAPDLSSFNDDSEALAKDLVSRIDRAIAVAEACSDFAPENNQIAAQGRAALVEIAAFFEVDPPGVGPGRVLP